MAPYPYRADAQEAARRARLLVEENADLARLRYAALDVRLAMEALIYSRAQAYSQDLPRSEIGAWQPKKLLAVLIDLDPLAGTSRKLEVAKGPPGSLLENDFFEIGSETVLGMGILKEHYNAVGNRLHMPTIKQLEDSGPHDPGRLRKRLATALDFLDQVLASTMWDATMMGLNSQIDCMRCGHRIRKAVEQGATAMQAKCPQCGAPYVLEINGQKGFNWMRDTVNIRCANPDCSDPIEVFRDEVKAGLVVGCPRCERRTEVAFCARAAPMGEGGASVGGVSPPGVPAPAEETPKTDFTEFED